MTQSVEAFQSVENVVAKEKNSLKRGPKDVIKVVLPVTACILIVVLVVVSVYSSDPVSISKSRYASQWNVMKEGKSNSTSQNIVSAVVNGLIVLGVTILMTCILLALYYFQFYKIIWGFIGFSNVTGIFMGTVFVGIRFFKINNWPTSWPTIFFVVLNWAIVVSLAILWKASLQLQQIAMIYLSCAMSLLFQLVLPPWTGWIVLGLLVIWDLVAVLSPCGPLKKFVELANERNERGSGPLSALVYTAGMAYYPPSSKRLIGGQDEEITPNDSQNEIREENEMKEVKEAGDEEEEHTGVQLGLGDFVFYSILIGKAAETGYWTTIFACYVSIIGRLIATVLLLIIREDALPALPISLTFGIIFYFGGEYTLIPFLTNLQRSQLLC